MPRQIGGTTAVVAHPERLPPAGYALPLSPPLKTGGYPNGDQPRAPSPERGFRHRSKTPEKARKSAKDQAVPQLHKSHATEAEVDLPHMLLEQFRKTIIHRGGSSGIHGLGRMFRIMDDDGNKKISAQEMRAGLKDYGLALDSHSVKMIMDAIDKHNDGTINFDKFLMAVRGPVSKRRRALIDLAFHVLDKRGAGEVTASDIAKAFSADHHPDVVAGKLQASKAVDHLLAQFGGRNGKISKDDFQRYYKNVSASIDDDDYFELMLRNAWHIPGGEGWCENTSNTRILVTFANGSQKVVTIDDDLGLDLKSFSAVTERLKKQGVKNVVKIARSS